MLERNVVLALLLATAGSSSKAAEPAAERWGPYDVSRHPLLGVFGDMLLLKNGVIAANAGLDGALFFFEPDGRVVAQVPTGSQTATATKFLLRPGRESPVLLSDGTVAVIANVDSYAGKVLFLDADGRIRGEYKTRGRPWAAAPLRRGGAAVLVGPRVEDWISEGAAAALRGVGNGAVESSRAGIVFLSSTGTFVGEIPIAAFPIPPPTKPSPFIPDSDLFELPDGRMLATTIFGTYLVARDHKSVRRWAPGLSLRAISVLNDGRVLAERIKLKGINKLVECRLVLAGFGGSVAADMGVGCEDLRNGIVLSRAAVQLKDRRIALSTTSGYVYVFDEHGHEKWHFKGRAGLGTPVELSNGGIVVASQDHRLYFLASDGKLLGAYQAETSFLAAPIELEDGRLLAVTSGNFGASHNLHVFSPTGRPFPAMPASSGSRCRVAGRQSWPFTTRVASCSDTEKLIDPPGEAPRGYDTLCLQFYADSRATNFSISQCLSGKRKTQATVEFDCEVCSDEPAGREAASPGQTEQRTVPMLR